MEEAGEKGREIVSAEEGRLPYDPEVEKKRLDVQKEVASIQAETLKGWQKTLSDAIAGLANAWKEGRAAEYRNVITLSKWIIAVCVVFFAGVGVLVYLGKISGDALVFLIGIIVGYLLSLVTPRPRRETPQ
jgi:hypothetical protein